MKTEPKRALRVKFKPGVSPQKRFEGVVRILVDLIEDGMRDQYVRKTAIEIVTAAGVKGHDEIGEIRALTKWIQNNMVYRKDTFGVEIFQEARKLIRDIKQGKSAGDCDDFVILGGSLLGALGYPVGALIVDSNGDGVFNHVMLVTKTFGPSKEFGRNWIPIELIYPEFRLGESVPITKVYPLMANAEAIRAPIMKKSIRGIAGLGSMARSMIADKHPKGTNKAHIDVMKTYMDKGMSFEEAHNAANKAGFLPKGEAKNCGCGKNPCKTYGSQNTNNGLKGLVEAHPYTRILGALFKGR